MSERAPLATKHMTTPASQVPLGLRTLTILSWCVILMGTGLAKILSAFGGAGAVRAEDPIIGIQFYYLFLAVGALELSVVILCVAPGTDFKTKVAVVAWVATLFAVYRLGLWWTGWRGPCGCLGRLTSTLHFSATAADRILKIALCYMLASSYWMLWRHRENNGLNEERGRMRVIC